MYLTNQFNIKYCNNCRGGNMDMKEAHEKSLQKIKENKITNIKDHTKFS